MGQGGRRRRSDQPRYRGRNGGLRQGQKLRAAGKAVQDAVGRLRNGWRAVGVPRTVSPEESGGGGGGGATQDCPEGEKQESS